MARSCINELTFASDTTATALTNIFIHLALYPEWHQRLQDEADEVFAAKTYSCLRPLPVLDAIINEVMRIQPSLFFSSQRVTPPEGMTIGETYIPGDTVISIPAYWLNHGLSSFPCPPSQLQLILTFR